MVLVFVLLSWLASADVDLGAGLTVTAMRPPGTEHLVTRPPDPADAAHRPVRVVFGVDGRPVWLVDVLAADSPAAANAAFAAWRAQIARPLPVGRELGDASVVSDGLAAFVSGSTFVAVHRVFGDRPACPVAARILSAL